LQDSGVEWSFDTYACL